MKKNSNKNAALARLAAAMQASSGNQAGPPTMGQPAPNMGMVEPGQYSGNDPQAAVDTTHRYDER